MTLALLVGLISVSFEVFAEVNMASLGFKEKELSLVSLCFCCDISNKIQFAKIHIIKDGKEGMWVYIRLKAVGKFGLTRVNFFLYQGYSFGILLIGCF